MEATGPIFRSPWLQWLLALLFPALRQQPLGDWPALLQAARRTEFDRLERAVTLAAVLVVAWQIKPVDPLDGSLGGYFGQFAVWLPALAACLLPCQVRRVRRGLAAGAGTERGAEKDHGQA